MVTFKFTVIFCAFLLVYQAQAKNEPQKNEKGFIDVLKKLVKEIETFIDKIIDETKSVVDAVTDDTWDDIQKKTVDVTNKIMNTFLDAVFDAMKQVGANSSDTGKKLVGCITGAEGDLVAARVGFYDDVSKCMGKEIVTVFKALSNLVTDLASIQEDAKTVADKINNCDGDDINGILCIVQVAGELIEIFKEIPAKISGDTATIKNDFAAVVEAGQKCIEDELPLYYAKNSKIIDGIYDCYKA